MKIISQDNYYIVSVKDDYFISLENFTTDLLKNIYIETSFLENKILLGTYSSSEKAERVMKEILEAIRIGYDYLMPKEDEVYVPYL